MYPLSHTDVPSSRRTLSTAEGVLIALRHCTSEDAFGEIVETARRHRVPLFALSQALVRAAAGEAATPNSPAQEVVRLAWGELLQPPY